MLNFSPEPVRGRHVLAALSGGADSVALLLLLCRARDEGILTLSAAHFDHGIRGAESATSPRRPNCWGKGWNPAPDDCAMIYSIAARKSPGPIASPWPIIRTIRRKRF